MTKTAIRVTPRQRQVHSLVRQGRDPKQIAKRLKIGVPGVYGHLRRLRDAGLLDEHNRPVEEARGTARAAETNGRANGKIANAHLAVKDAIEAEGQEHERLVKYLAEAEEEAAILRDRQASAEVQAKESLERMESLRQAEAALPA